MDDFNQIVALIPPDQRCVQTDAGRFRSYPLDYCFFGVPSDTLYGRAPLERMPQAPPGMAFLAAAEQADLISAFVYSSYAQSIGELSIGSSSYSSGARLDYTEAVGRLRGAGCPRLQRLHLGIWQLFSNSHGAYGRLGELTAPLATFASLEELGLYGHFTLAHPLQLEQLRLLSVESSDPTTALNSEPLSQDTLDQLLLSEMPCLEEIFLDLFCHAGQTRYTLPDRFLAGDGLRQLRMLELDGRSLAPGEQARLLSSPLGRRLGAQLRIDDFA